MSSEKFDEHIRRKLDQIEPAADAGAWGRIQSRLPESPGIWTSFSWKKTGIALYMAGTTAALVLLWWKQEKLDRKNQELDAQVQQLVATKQKNADPQAQSAIEAGLSKSGRSIYDVKDSDEQDLVQGESQNANSKGGKAQESDLTKQTAVAGIAYPKQGSSFVSGGKSAKVSAFKPDREGFKIKAKGSEAEPDGTGDLSSSGSGMAPPTEGNLPAISIGSASQKNIQQTQSEPLGHKENGQKQALPIVASLDSIQKKPLLTERKDSVPAAIRNLGQKPKPSVFAGLKPRVGLDFSTDFGSMAGPGVHAEFSLSPRFTTSIGFIAYFPVKEQFRGEADFNARTGLNFIHQYGDHLPADYHEVEAIQIKTRILEVPIRFRYFTPINSHWHWLIGLGTHFNISARQELNCEVHMNQGDDEFLAYGHRPTPAFFHNMEFSSGLEYQNGGLAVRFTPYYQYNFSTLQYLDRVHLLAFNVGVYIRP
jgi:hypothetical protein